MTILDIGKNILNSFKTSIAQNQEKNRNKPVGRGTQKVRNYFNPEVDNDLNQYGVQNFWTNNPIKIASGLGNAQKFVEKPPKFSFSQTATQNIKEPIPKFITQAALSIPESILNIPSNSLEAGSYIGRDIRTGDIKKPVVLISDLSRAAIPIFDAATLGSGTIMKNIGKQAVKEAGKTSLKKAFVKGAAEGGIFAGAYGALQGLVDGRDDNLLTQVTNAVKSGATNAIFGAGTGGVLGVSGNAFGRVWNAYRGVHPDLSDKEITKKAAHFIVTGGQPRGKDGKFVLKTPQVKPNKAQQESWAQINRTLGRPENTPVYPSDADKAVRIQLGFPEDGSSQGGFVDFSELVPKNKASQERLTDIDNAFKIEQDIHSNNVRIQQDFLNGKITQAQRDKLITENNARSVAQQQIGDTKLRFKEGTEGQQLPVETPLETSPEITAKETSPQDALNTENLLSDQLISPSSTSISNTTSEAQKRLKNLLTYDDELLRLGYSPSQINKLNAVTAREIIEKQIAPPNNSTFTRGSGLQTGNKEVPFQQQSRDTQARFDDHVDGNQSRFPVQEDPMQSSTELPFDDIVNKSGLDVKEKVSILDYFRTPDRILKKIGLGKEAVEIRKAYDNYVAELPKEIDKITQWSKRVSPDANRRIFQYLDGQRVTLQGEELKVAQEIREYLKGWADRLDLPEDNRIASYITHIFEKDFIQKEFDPDIAKLIRDKVPGSVYDPFLEKRLGKMGYLEDTWQALDAYVKRATRKAHMDPVLNDISMKADSLEESQYKYVKRYTDRINMRPTELDNLIDNTVKQIVGYRFGQRPVANISRKLRQTVYRGMLGLNVGSALRNLSQGANTYAKLGEKYTVVGYTKLLSKMATNDLKELYDVGVLRDDFIQDRTLNATRKTMERLDKGLFFFFETAEKINRGAAYYGAKSKALKQGKSEEEAIEFARNLVRDTQFTFGSVDTPVALQSDLAKILTQMQSFTVKQGEFIGEMAKAKDVAGLLRYSLAGLGYVYTVGQLFGMKPQELIPTLRFGVPTAELPKAIFDAAKGEDEYGNEMDTGDRVKTILKGIKPYVPGGVQAVKTYEGLTDVSKGYSESAGGRVRYPIEQSTSNYIRGSLFGKHNLPEAQAYYDADRTPLGENQTEAFKSLDKSGQKSLYENIIGEREENAAVKELTDKSGGGTVGDKIVTRDGKVIDLKTPTTGQGIKAFTNQNWKYTKAREIWDADLTNEQKEAAFKKLGVEPKDVRYDSLAHYDNDIKTQYIVSKNLEHDELIERLITGRVESVSGELFASNGVIDNLYEQGLITSEERTALKKMKFDKDGKDLSKSTGKKKKGKKVSISSTTIKSEKLPESVFKLTQPTKLNLKSSPKLNLKTSAAKAGDIPKFKASGFRNDLA